MDKPGKGLSRKQKRFCRHYSINLNATVAYLEAYKVSRKTTASAAGTRLLGNVKIQRYLKHLNNDIADTLGITKQQIVQEFAKMAFANLADYFDDWDNVKSLENLSDDQKAAMSETSTSEQKYGKTFRLKLHDKSKALLELAKMLGFDEPIKLDLEVSGTKQVFIVNGSEIEF